MYLREETKLEFRLPSPVFLIGLSTQLSPAERTGDKVAGAVPHLGACFPQACREGVGAGGTTVQLAGSLAPHWTYFCETSSCVTAERQDYR